MPEVAGEVTLRAMALGVVVFVLAVAGLSLLFAFAARRLSPSVTWAIWGGTVLAIGASGLAALGSQSVEQVVGLPYTVFFLATMIGLPSAAAVWTAVRRARSQPPRHILVDAGLVAATFVVILPVAAIVAALPDFVRVLG